MSKPLNQSFWGAWRKSEEADNADAAEFARRYGNEDRYRSEAERIATHFNQVGAEDVYALLKDITPRIYSAEAGFIRRWKYGGHDKENSPIGRPMHKKAKYRNSQRLINHIRFTGSGRKPKVLANEKYTDGSPRPITRAPLYEIAKFLPAWAKTHGFPESQMSVQFRSQDKTGLRSGGDDHKELHELTDLKRLCVLVAEFFYDGYEIRDWL